MFKKIRTCAFVSFGIVALACMLFAGQAWAQCVEPPPDSDSDGCTDPQDLCPSDPADACAPTVLPGALLSVTSGCATFEGPHPNPDWTGEIACCSYNNPPKCGAADTPDVECVYTYEFCSDGTAMKGWDSDPTPDSMPGYIQATGTWAYNVDNELVISLTANIFGMTLTSVETYGVAFTYDGGTKLDWFSVAKDSGTSVLGSYASDGAIASDIPGGFMDYDASIDRDMTVSAGCPPTWAQTETVTQTCTGGACSPDMNGTDVDNTNGTIPVPNGKLYQVGSDYVLQTSTTLVMEKQ